MPSPGFQLTVRQLLTNALIEIGAYSVGEQLSNEDADFAMSKLNRMLDMWNAKSVYIYNVSFAEYLIIPNTQPLTIGQAVVITQASLTANIATYIAKNSYKQGDFVDVGGCTTAALNVTKQVVANANSTQFQLAIVNANIPTENEANAKAVYSTGVPIPNYAVDGPRPAKIPAGNIILNNVNPPVRSPLHPRDDAWWANQRVQTISTTLPTDMYYSPKFPNGEINLWPIPTVAYGLELEIWDSLGGFSSLDVSFYLPQGYENAVTLTLAEELCPAFGKALDVTLQRKAAEARTAIQGLNSVAPRISTKDAGMPSPPQRRATFNYRTGMDVPH